MFSFWGFSVHVSRLEMTGNETVYAVCEVRALFDNFYIHDVMVVFLEERE